MFTCISFAQFSSSWVRVEAIRSPFINVVYTCNENYYAATDSLLYLSSDRGQNWHSVFIAEYIEVILKTDNYLFVGSLGDGVFRSPDNGITWEPFNNGLSSWGKYARHFLLIGDTLYLGSDGGGVYYTNLKTGEGWKEYNENLPSNIAWTINAMAISENNLILSAGASGFYYIRQLGSSEWIERTIDGSTKYITPSALISFGDTVFAGVSRSIFRSIDNGLTWDSVGIKALPLQVRGFAKYNNRIYAALTRANDFFIWYSDDGGFTWNSNFHEFTELNKFYIGDNKIWAATYQGLWYSEIEATDVRDDRINYDFYLGQNYPNPFNPVTNFQFRIPASRSGGSNFGSHGMTSFVSLKVYDILGMEVATLVNEYKPAGDYKIAFNAGNLSSGIYFYQLRAGDFIQTKKMVLLK